MSEVRTPVRAIRVTRICDECGEGEMEMIDRARPTVTLTLLHMCSNKECEATTHFRFGKPYPRIEYEEIED